MLRTYSWKWLGISALVLTPAVVYGQGSAAQSHTVHQGDTLWDLAKQYRGDPFLWPDIYRMNTAVVADPHWIYPGEVLRLSGAEAVASVPAEDTPEPTSTTVAGASTAPAMDSPAMDASSMDAPGAESVTPAPESPMAQSEPATPKTLAEMSREPVGEGDEPAPLFGPKPSDNLKETILAYTRKEYQPLRRSEFYASGFLTENKHLPWAKVVGSVTPSQIGSPVINDVLPFEIIAIDAPKGATYQIGDTLLLAQIGVELKPYGDAIMPTGLARITDTVSGRYLAEVQAIYAPIRPGQVAMPAERFTPAGAERAAPVSDGVRGVLLGGPKRQELKEPQMVVFINKGKQDGVAPGDIFEVRRTAERLESGQQRTNELLATLQIVHVRDHTATGRYLNIYLPDIASGTQVRQVAKLPS